MPNNLSEDIKLSIKSLNLWWSLAVLQTIQRYRRSILGPFWITLSNLIFIAALSFILNRVFKAPISDLIPYITYGYLSWLFISGSVIESCDVFLVSAGYIKNITMPITSHIFINLFKNIIIFFHNFAIILVVIIVFGEVEFINFIILCFNFFLLCIVLFFVYLFFSLICLRYRDITQIIISITQVMFFVTPVWWDEKTFGNRTIILDLNPFYHLISLIRKPLINESVGFETLVFLALFFFIFVPFIFLLFKKKYSRIPFWL